MRAILPIYRTLIDQLQIGFVNQRRSFQHLLVTLAMQVLMCNAAQLVINDRQQVSERLLIAIAPLAQQRGHIMLFDVHKTEHRLVQYPATQSSQSNRFATVSGWRPHHNPTSRSKNQRSEERRVGKECRS